MAPAPSASAFPLHPNSCLLDEHDRMLFQHSHPTGTDAERTTLQEGVEGFSAAISKAIQPQSHALHLDQRAGTLPTHHRSNERVPGSSSQATKAAEDPPKYYKELTVRCTSPCSLSSRARTSVPVEGPALKTFGGSPLLQQGEAGLQSSGRAFDLEMGFSPGISRSPALKRAIKTRTFPPA